MLHELLSTDFLPHGHCYFWNPSLIALHVISDGLITLSYYSIPVLLVVFVQKKRDVPFHWIFLMFGAFILACGTTHAMEIWTLWYPAYWLSGLVKAGTAAISLATAAALVPLIPHALALRSPAELEAANRALEQEIRERKRTQEKLAESRDKALEAARLKAAFVANMSHEIRTPLNIILGCSELIDDHLLKIGDRSQTAIFTGLRDASKRLMTTIHGILDLSRIETGAFEVLPVPLQASGLVERAIHELAPMATAKGLKLVCELEEREAVVLFDEYCLAQAVGHLLHNAIKFTEAGTVVVRLHRDHDDQLCLTVADTGVGIDERFLERVFEPFSQEDSGTTRGFEGNGLGLALCKSYVAMNHARLSVDSAKGKGSSFTIRFLPSRELRDRALDGSIRPHPLHVED